MVRFLVAAVLIGHGLGHVMMFLAAWTSVPVGFKEEPWILPGAFTLTSPVGRAFALLWLVALIAFVGAGFGLLAQQSWWPALAVAAAIISLMVIIPWWSTINPSSRLWAALVDALVLLALLLPWREQLLEAVGG